MSATRTDLTYTVASTLLPDARATLLVPVQHNAATWQSLVGRLHAVPYLVRLFDNLVQLFVPPDVQLSLLGAGQQGLLRQVQQAGQRQHPRGVPEHGAVRPETTRRLSLAARTSLRTPLRKI